MAKAPTAALSEPLAQPKHGSPHTLSGTRQRASRERKHRAVNAGSGADMDLGQTDLERAESTPSKASKSIHVLGMGLGARRERTNAGLQAARARGRVGAR